jgi:hypothetical protein
MGVVLASYILEGSLCGLIERRRALIERMAETLVAEGCALDSDQDAVRLLTFRGYRMIDAAILAGEARTLAFQDVVAREMGKA